jgi:serine/threonine-protein kinase
MYQKIVVALLLFLSAQVCCAATKQLDSPKKDAVKQETITVTAVGLADLNSDTYKRDKGLAIDAARDDARRQAIEKAVGTQIESSTLVKNYALVEDKILSKSKGLIKKILSENHWEGKDGLLHVEIEAEVFLSSIKDALKSMSESERLDLLKKYNNPRISVAVFVRDAERGSENSHTERSKLAENVLRDYFAKFGYRVWSEEKAEKIRMEMFERSQVKGQNEVLVDIAHLKTSDFFVTGEAKFEKRSVKLQASGITVNSYVLTSWSVECVDSSTGESIYHNNKVPKSKAWSNEDQALEEIGKLIGMEFSQEFFERYLMQASRIYQVEVAGLPSYQVAQLLKQEMKGLRPILRAELRDFNTGTISNFEVEFTGERNNFMDVLHTAVVEPLNKKFGADSLKLESASGKTLRFSFQQK